MKSKHENLLAVEVRLLSSSFARSFFRLSVYAQLSLWFLPGMMS